MIVDLRKEGSSFGKKLKKREELNSNDKDAAMGEESMQQFDDLLQESIHVLESTLGELEKK